ncbi:MAG: lysyl oxidase family protein [Acidimicrobiia bacterium]
MRPPFRFRHLAPFAVAAFTVTMLAPGSALAHISQPPEPPEPAPEANVVPIVGDLSISTRDSDDHSIEDGCVSPGSHRLLCFDFWTNNIGQADFVVGSPTERPDLYGKSLPCQFVVIDGVADGTYVLRSTTNAQRVVPESTYADNTIYTYLQISGAHVTQLEGPPPWADPPMWDV